MEAGQEKVRDKMMHSIQALKVLGHRRWCLEHQIGCLNVQEGRVSTGPGGEVEAQSELVPEGLVLVGPLQGRWARVVA